MTGLQTLKIFSNQCIDQAYRGGCQVYAAFRLKNNHQISLGDLYFSYL